MTAPGQKIQSTNLCIVWPVVRVSRVISTDPEKSVRNPVELHRPKWL